MNRQSPALTLRSRTVHAGLIAVCLCGMMSAVSETSAEDGVVRIQSQAAPIAQAGYVGFSDQAIHYELHRPSPYGGHSVGDGYAMPQRHHPVDRWFYVRRLLRLDQPNTPYPRFQYNYGHGVSSSRLTPTSRAWQ